MSDSASFSASPVRPSAKRQKARYSSACRDNAGAPSPSLRRVSTDSASSYAADAYNSLAALSCSWPASTAAAAKIADAASTIHFISRLESVRLVEIDSDAVRPLDRHDDALAPLA